MKRALGAGLGLALLLGAPPAQAYVRTHVSASSDASPCLFWGPRQVPYRLVMKSDGHASQRLNNDQAFAALRASLLTWTNAACSDFAFVEKDQSNDIQVGFNRPLLNQPFLAGDVIAQNLLMFRSSSCQAVVPTGDSCLDPANNDCASLYDCWDYSDNTIALTTSTYSYQTGQIFDADIELNEFIYHFTVADPNPPLINACPTNNDTFQCVGIDLQNTVTHEAGHVLGLGHTTVADATMYPSASLGEINKRVLHADDLQGLCDIYPTGAATLTCNLPTNSGCGCSQVDGGLLGLGLALAAMRRARRT